MGLCVALLTVALAPLGCEGSSSNGGAPTNDSGVYTPPDGGDPDPPVASECTPPTGGPTTHPGAINGDETWTAAASPHILPYDTTIYKTVTLEPCAELLIAGGHGITLRTAGQLIAEGTATKRIHIGAQDKSKPFANIRALAPSTARFAYTTIDGGGVPQATAPYLTGTLDFQGDGQQPTQQTLFVDHVTVEGSMSNGITLGGNAGFAEGSNALVIKGSAQFPLSVLARSVGGIPVGSYTGNGTDQILLPTTSSNETIDETTTLHERGVPYLVGHATSAGDLRVDVPQGKTPVTLTIEPGVTMRFKKAGTLRIAVASGTSPARGSLIAVGTADKPIIFTSNEASPAAGDWLGLSFGELPTAENKIDHVRVEYAGGASASGSGSCPDNAELMNNAAIRITGWPAAQFITNTAIVGSATNGIDRGWRDDREKVDFLSTITFTDVALCNQTFPPDAANVCPQPASAVPCPKN
ncbi:MAG TPA: hypothetical protein VLT33_00950 [Labilithrix sp.]|nr:hypothetical protein [Labilithrix sp.]